jgi:ATP-dependent DNA ligase
MTPLPRWVRPQLTQLVDAAPEGDQWLHEIKYDGYRMHARLDRGAAKLLTRTGLDWTHKYPIAKAVSLVSFNLGVEAGQVAIVAAFLPLAYLSRRSWLYPRVVLGFGSCCIAAAARCGWSSGA